MVLIGNQYLGDECRYLVGAIGNLFLEDEFLVLVVFLDSPCLVDVGFEDVVDSLVLVVLVVRLAQESRFQ